MVAIGTRRTPIEIDPFAVAVAETVEMLLGSRCSALAVTVAPFASFSVDKRVMITSDLFDPDVAGLTLTSDGSPTQCVVWIENGGVNNFDFDRYSTQTERHNQFWRLDSKQRCNVVALEVGWFDATGFAGYAFLALAAGQPAHNSLYRSHARQHLSDRERHDHEADEESSIRQLTDLHGSTNQGPRFQFYQFEWRGVTAS